MIKKKKTNRPELLVPAGNLEKLKLGLLYGADAFYLGLPSFSMRSRINNFTDESLAEGVDLIRKAGKVFYLTMNIYPRGNKIDAFKKHIGFVREKIKPDAIIVADPGVFELVKEYCPECVLHMSVQANVLNYRAVEFWRKQGAKRIILPRELMLPEIKEIHKNVPDIELEFFVHGAICMAYSGRCLLSNYMTGRDSNQGICAHSCRWEYKVHDKESMVKKNQSLMEKFKNSDDEEIFLEEKERPNEFMPVDEDEHGTYFMNSKDMCLLPYLKDLAEAGICSFKVEGRNKSEHYLSTVTKTYRCAIDDFVSGKDFNESLLWELGKTANRGFIPGYLFGFPGANDIDYNDTSSLSHQSARFAGMIKGRVQKGIYHVSVRNCLEKGAEVEIMTPTGDIIGKIEGIFDLESNEVDAAHGGAGDRLLKISSVKEIPNYSMLRIKGTPATR
ncbi:U32 family peptidase C-terminal domain-containing protein [Candidatus Peregrinibacteria bacterium]|nr:U32 family peptidase C-terminal domain-containing protein [Candidatus Peregrinibacteria bacterium]